MRPSFLKFDLKKNERIVGVLVILFLLVLIVIGTRNNDEKENNTIAVAAAQINKIEKLDRTEIEPNEVVLTIDNTEITYEKYKYYLETIKESLDAGDESYWFAQNTTAITLNDTNTIAEVNINTTPEQLETMVIERLKEIVVINNLAKENGLEYSDEEIEENLQSIIDSVGEDEFNRVLKEENISRELYKDILKSAMQEEGLLKVLFYEEIYDKMSNADIARIKHILVTYNDEITTSGDITQEMENALTVNAIGGTIQIATANVETSLYREQDETSKVLSAVKEKETFTVVGMSEDGNWVITSYNNNNAYLKASDVTISEEIIEAFYEDGTISEETIEAKTEASPISSVASAISSRNVPVKQLTKQEAFDLSKSILAQLDSGASFDELMQQYTEDASMINNEDGYYILKSEEDTTIIEDTTFLLDENEYSKIIETNLGFHIIMRCPLEEEYVNEHILDYADDTIWKEYDALLTLKTVDMKYTLGEKYKGAYLNTFIDAYEKYQKILAENE